MIHGIYVKSRPKNKWRLVSLCLTTEMANHDIDTILKQAKLEGNENIQTAIQMFESGFYIPEILSKLKEYKPLYN